MTINRFRFEHQDALAGLFGDVLTLCARAGMVRVGTVAVDGTRMAANASKEQTVDYEQLARKILEEAAEIDAAEDELYGDRRGDELPEQLTTGKGRQEWLRDAKRQLEAERAANPKPVPRARAPRLKEAKRRLQEELWAEQRANAAYEAWRVTAKDTLGRGLGAPPTPYTPPELPAGTVNLTDPDSRIVQSRRGFMQGYTAQAVATREQIVITADVIAGGNERQTLEPLIDKAHDELARAGVTDMVGSAVADAGFWNTDQIARLTDRGIKTLVSPDAGKRKTPGLTRQRRKQLSRDARTVSHRRGQTVVPTTSSDHRARVRTDQTQPTDRSVPTKRVVGLQGRMATDHSDPQPPQALATQPGDRHRIAGGDPAPWTADSATSDRADPLPIGAERALRNSLVAKPQLRRRRTARVRVGCPSWCGPRACGHAAASWRAVGR